MKCSHSDIAAKGPAINPLFRGSLREFFQAAIFIQTRTVPSQIALPITTECLENVTTLQYVARFARYAFSLCAVVLFAHCAIADTTCIAEEIACNPGLAALVLSMRGNLILTSSLASGYTFKNGATDTLTVRLAKQPLSTVTIPVAISNTSQASVSPASLTFSPDDWTSPRTITVAGLDDLKYGVTGTFVVNFGPSVSSDSTSDGMIARSSSVSNRDFRKLIFQSNTAVNGNVGGITGADGICNADQLKPADTGAYKALIVVTGVRVASITPHLGDGQVDWVLRPNQLYTRADGTVITTTNSTSIHVFGPNLTNSIGTNGAAMWTGLNADWTTAGGCANWTDGSAGPFGRYGSNSATLSAIQGGNIICTSLNNLYCVQQ